jgi:hypothetical protein
VFSVLLKRLEVSHIFIIMAINLTLEKFNDLERFISRYGLRFKLSSIKDEITSRFKDNWQLNDVFSFFAIS